MINDLIDNDDIYIYDDDDNTKEIIEHPTINENVDNEYIEKCLKEIQLEVKRILKEEGYITTIDGKDIPEMGCCHREWEITKKLMKERYNIEWQSPQSKHPEIDYD